MVDSWYVLGMFGAVILAALGAMAVAVGKGVRGWPVTPQPSAVPADLQLRVRMLLGRDRPIQAIKEVREATGLNLKEAKGVVDALRSGPLPESPAGGGPSVAGGPGSLAERARNLRDGGDLASAVALVCAESGMTQHEAERFVAVLD